MKQLSAIFLLFVMVALPLQAASLQFGGAVDKSAQVAISEVQAKPELFLGKTITVQAEVVSVCQKKGCWMQLAAGDGKQLKIKVRDGVMEFPVSARGKQALATGQLVKIELDLESSREQLAAQAKEQGTTFDPATVTSPMVSWQLVPTAVEILN